MAIEQHGGAHSQGAPHLTAGDTFLALAAASAPALLLAYLGAALLMAFLTPATAAWLDGGRGAGQALRGVGYGLPLPICSCGVLPVYERLVRGGAPATAALAFLVAGLLSIAFTGLAGLEFGS